MKTDDEVYLVGIKNGECPELRDIADQMVGFLEDLNERRKAKIQEAIDGNLWAAAQLRNYYEANGQPLKLWIHQGRRLV